MIQLIHLRKEFSDNTPIKDVNLTINKGDVISIIGPSGTGKSTLLRLINNLEEPTSGKIIIDGADLSDKKTNLFDMRKKVGMVFQFFNLFSHKTAIENVMMGPVDLQGVPKQQAYDEGIKLLKSVGLAERVDFFPDELSGGQQQRVAIARCLAMKPEVILFDEPTSALDPTMVGEVQAVIKKLADEGHTMMIVTHDLEFSKNVSNRIVFMYDGRVYDDGTPEEIFDHPVKERTRAFVKKLRTYEYSIRSANFDIYSLFAGINTFGKNMFLTKKQINNLEVIIEEIVINNIMKKTVEIDIQIGYFEADKKLEIVFLYNGEAYNPFETTDEDVLSMLLVRQLIKEYDYKYVDNNILTIKLKNN